MLTHLYHFSIMNFQHNIRAQWCVCPNLVWVKNSRQKFKYSFAALDRW